MAASEQAGWLCSKLFSITAREWRRVKTRRVLLKNMLYALSVVCMRQCTLPTRNATCECLRALWSTEKLPVQTHNIHSMYAPRAQNPITGAGAAHPSSSSIRNAPYRMGPELLHLLLLLLERLLAAVTNGESTERCKMERASRNQRYRDLLAMSVVVDACSLGCRKEIYEHPCPSTYYSSNMLAYSRTTTHLFALLRKWRETTTTCPPVCLCAFGGVECEWVVALWAVNVGLIQALGARSCIEHLR